MGRIVVQIKIINRYGGNKSMEFSVLVDTGAGYLTLPKKWKKQLGDFDLTQKTIVRLGDETNIEGEICGPLRIEVEGFRPIYGEVLFINMKESTDGEYQSLLGYIPLESIPVAVDMLGHRLVPVKTVDCKAFVAPIP